eukprot:GILI01023392.1.p1 GENE.GILI01023392.1~~GILI01023392.1.p1  ORF type:complete len:199 (+),score=31.97 GILI01023392.1:77-673(+)
MDNAYFRMLYLRREYARLQSASDDLKGCFIVPESSTPAQDIWKGLLIFRDKKSPWFKGVFSFSIVFPQQYPFECPTVIFDRPFSAHPNLTDGCKVPFEIEFMSISAMQTSVLSRLLRFTRQMFVVDENTLAKLDLEAIQRDVQNCSIVANELAPYKKHFGEESVKQLIEIEDKRKDGIDMDTIVSEWSMKKHASRAAV